MGVLAHGSAHTRPSAQPRINMSGKKLPHMYANSPPNISPNPSEVIYEFLWLLIGILIFLFLRSACKVSEPYYNPFWEKSNVVNGGLLFH